ncbi:MAG: DUF2723 domain-containing protein [Candidatus Coatesbacteria bacterium]
MTAVVWLAVFAVYLRGVAGSFYFEDSPELLAAAATLGNSHEPGTPPWLLVGRLALLLPAGGPAFRVNVAAAACAALAAVWLGSLAAAILRTWGRSDATARWAGVFVTLVWGFSDTFWWQAGIGDKYPALYLGCVAVLWAAWKTTAEGGLRPLLGLALLLGLGLAHHPFVFFAVPAAACGVVSALPGERRRARLLGLGLVLVVLPLSVRVMYPPVRAGADLDWGDPRTSFRLERYLTAARYRPPEPDPLRPALEGPVRTGSRLFLRLTGEELPWLILAAAPAGLALGIARSTLWTVAVPWVVVLNLAFAIHTPMKVARWYGPAWAVLVLFAGLGVGVLAGLLRRRRAAAVVAATLAVLGGGWQAGRGLDRNDFSRWYAAHDYARNILSSLPPGAVYLGRGDDDLFPLWAVRFAEGDRADVEAVGMGSLVDLAPADVGGNRRLVARFHLEGLGWEALRWLLGGPPQPGAFYAKTGYDSPLWEALDLGRHRARGLVARWPGRWDPAGSLADTRRAIRGYTWRGLRYARAGAVFDLERPRDEVARDALLHQAFCFSTLGAQFLAFDGPSRAAEAAWAFGMARRLAEPLTGPLPVRTAGFTPLAVAITERNALAAGVLRLADLFAARDVAPLAAAYLAAVDSMRVIVAPKNP